MGKALIAALWALALCSPARAQTPAAPVFTLAQLEQQALSKRPELVADGHRVQAAEAEMSRARGAGLPQIGLEVEGMLGPGREIIDVERYGGTNGPTGDAYKVSASRALGDDGAFNPQARYGAEISLRQNLYDFGRTSSTVDAARARRATAEAERDASAQRILDTVRSSYLVWLSHSELATIAEQSATDATRRRERAQALIAEGVRPQADLAPAEAEEMLAALELERARGELAAARLVASQASGLALPADARPDATLLDATDGQGGAAEDGAETEDATLRALESQRKAAQASARAQDKSNAPVLAGVLSAGVRGQNSTPFPSYAVGVSLSVPLTDGGRASASASAARARTQALDATIEAHTMRQQQAQDRATLSHGNATARLSAAHKLLTISQRRLQEAEQAYELGAGGLEAIGRARAMLRRAQTEVVLAKVARTRATLLQTR